MSTSFARIGVVAVGALAAASAMAGTNPYFNPLTQSSAIATPQHVNELNSPWQMPAGVSARNLTSLAEIQADPTQSAQRVEQGPAVPNFASMFDMVAYDPQARFLFIPQETPYGASLARYDIANDRTDLMFAGDQGAGPWPQNNSTCLIDPANPNDLSNCPTWDNDYAAFDPARFSPNGTVLMGEEWAGLGRVVEVLKPLGPAPANPSAAVLTEGVDYRILTSFANVSHEGIAFSKKYHNQVIYFIDEWNSGSVYALHLKKRGDYLGGGQTFVLSVDAFAATGGNSALDFGAGSNANAERFGAATWVPLTDKDGTPLPGIRNPFLDGFFGSPNSATTMGGRGAADDAGGTPYGRPEDVEVGVLPNGNEILYVATTSEHAVISIEILQGMKATVRRFANRQTPRNLGFPATTGTLDSSDNLAQDALGNIYIVEDEPNSGTVGGDVWFARDTNNDGVAESIDHFLSIQVAGSESTGLIFHPVEPTKFVLNVMHPDSVLLRDSAGAFNGFGDAVWEFDISDVVPPTCDDRGRFGSHDRWQPIYNWHTREWINTCSRDEDFQFIRQLERAGKPAPPWGRWGRN